MASVVLSVDYALYTRQMRGDISAAQS